MKIKSVYFLGYTSDMRIMEILVAKEEQAYKNIGDPTLLMGKSNVEEEEQMTTEAIEQGMAAEKFGKIIDETAKEFDPFEALMMESTANEAPTEVKEDDTLYSDIDYLKSAMTYFAASEKCPIQNLATVSGVEIAVTPDLKRRLSALLPEEEMPTNNFIRLSPDKAFCMAEMKRSMQNDMAENAWPQTQYLWALHPIFSWINDKAGLLFNRSEAPLIGLQNILQKNECVFIVAGTVPNRKSTPVVDEWFGLSFVDGKYQGKMTMEQVIQKIGFGRNDLPNRNLVSFDNVEMAKKLLPVAVAEAKKVLLEYCSLYRSRINPQIDEELDKLAGLQVEHKVYQLSLFENERKKSEKEREIDKLFDDFANWVKDTLDIEDNPYLRIVASVVGV